MSYCRFGEDGSSVYVFGSNQGLECCACRLGTQTFICKKEEEMISHLAQHKRANQRVLEDTVLALWKDIGGGNGG